MIEIMFTGPTHWGEQYNTCFGKYQSPIDINSLTVKHARLPPLTLNDTHVPPGQTVIKNNGHTGEFEKEFCLQITKINGRV